jgi:autotransporter-associated beta strand protein
MKKPQPAQTVQAAGRRRVVACACALAGSLFAKRTEAQLTSFPGAEGFGQYATGGRGGSVYQVTNLNDSGNGSFRAAIAAAQSQGSGIIVFDVGGYIDLQSAVSIPSNVTILGQTAPGQGIGFQGNELSLTDSTNDIVQDIRSRIGSAGPSTAASINLGDSSDVILDHVSVEYSQYDNIDAVGANSNTNNLTVQNSILADPIKAQQFNMHTEGYNVSYLNNVWANAEGRSALSKANDQFVNNVIYDYGFAYTSANTGGLHSHDVIGNYFITGNSTNQASDNWYQLSTNDSIYASGNMLDSNNDGKLNGSATAPSGVTNLSSPWSPTTAYLPILSAADAYKFDIANAGASPLNRDSVDAQVISQVKSLGNGTSTAVTGEVYNTNADTGLANGGFGTITGGNVSMSTANDGIPDSWAMSHGLNINDSTGSTKLNALGYDMIEEYAQQLIDSYSNQTWSASHGDWVSNSANWSATLPGDYDHALIRGTGAANGVVTVSGSDAASAFSVSIGGNGPAAGESLTVSGGSLTVYNTITVGDQNNGTLTITGGNVQADNVQLGNTVWTASGNSSTTYTGTFVLSGGTLQVGEVVQGGGTPGSWTTGSAWTWSGGTLQAGLGGLLVSAPATLGAAGGILDTNGVTAQISGVLSGPGGFTVIGGGTATVSGSNTYLGATTITSGTLAATLLANGGSPSSLGSSSNAAANLILNGGTLLGTGNTDRLFTLNANSTLDNSNGMSFTNTGAIALATSGNLTLTLTGSNTSHNTFSPSLGDPGNGFVTSVVISGAGQWDFSNGAKTYSGDTDLTGGLMEGLSTNALSQNSNMVISSGATLELHTYSQIINALSGNGTLQNTFGGTPTLTVGQANGSGNFSGAINGSLALIKTGTGTQTLSGVSTYSGSTTISGGTLTIGGAGELGSGTYSGNISNLATLNYASSASQTLSGVISGNGALTETGSGAGTLALSAANTYSGVTTLGAGTLQLQANASNTAGGVTSVLGNTPELLLAANTTLQLLGNTTNTIFAPAGTPAATSTTSGVLETTSNGPFNFFAGNNGAGSGNTLILANFGEFGAPNTTPTFNFSSANNYNLQIGSGAAGNGTLNFYNNTTINSNTAGATLLIPGGVAVNYPAAYTLTFGGAGNITTGALTNPTGNLSVIKNGTGTLTVSAASTYAGATTVAGGVFSVTGSINSGTTGSVTVGNTASTPATLQIAGNVTANTLAVGTNSTAAGAVRQTAGAVSFGQAQSATNFQLGAVASGYGYFNLSGGSLTANEFDIGGAFAGAAGVMDVTGGAATSNGYITIGRGTTNSSGSLNVTGGTVNFGATLGTGPLDLDWGNSTGAVAVVNIGGGAGAAAVTGISSLTTSGEFAGHGLNLTASTTAGTEGIVNLLGNGTLTVSDLEASATSTSLLNFNGGTLKATSTNLGTTFLTNGNITGVYVYGGNGTIDNGGTNITVGKALLAPIGSGVSSVSISSSSPTSYTAAPLVTFTGGNGTGATGYAVLTASGNLSGIVVTNPGTGYTSAPTVVLTGGGGSGWSGTAATATNASGGMTFQGSGTTTLTGASTYTGPTTVNRGTLYLNFSASAAPTSNIIGNSSALVLGSGATLQVVGNSAGGNSQAFSSATFNSGRSTITAAPASGTNLPAVALNGISQNVGGTVQFVGPATINSSGNVTATANITTTTSGAGTGGVLANFGVGTTGAYATVGLYDWAAVSGSNPGTIVGLSQNGGYQTSGLTTGGNYDVTAGSTNTIGNAGGPNTVRFNSSAAGALTLTENTSLFWSNTQGFLVTPNVGADNAVVTTNAGGQFEFYRSTSAGNNYGDIWQNNTSGYLIFSIPIAAGREASGGGNSDGLVQAGPGTVVYNAANTYELPTYLNGGYSVVSADSGFGQVANGSTVYLNGGTVVGNATFTMDNLGSNLRPFVLGSNGGGLAATSGNTMTIDGVVSGNAPLTIGFGTLPGSGNGTANPTAVTGNGTVILNGANSYTAGTTISAGTLLANSADTTYGSTGLGLVTVAGGGTLGGTGQIRGSITVNGTITAGAAASGVAPGVLTANAPGQTTTFAGGGAYNVKIDSRSANGLAGANWDELILSGLAVTASSGNAFTVALNSLNASNTAGAISGLNSSAWVVATMTQAPTGLTLSGNGTTILAVTGNGTGAPTVTSGDSGIFALNTSAFDSTNGINSTFTYFALELINTSGTNYNLDVYYAAPEPGVPLLMLAGALPSLLARRRRN